MTVIHWIAIYLVDSVIHPLNNWAKKPYFLEVYLCSCFICSPFATNAVTACSRLPEPPIPAIHPQLIFFDKGPADKQIKTLIILSGENVSPRPHFVLTLTLLTDSLAFFCVEK